MKSIVSTSAAIVLCMLLVGSTPLTTLAQDPAATTTFWRADPSMLASWFGGDNWSAGVPTEMTAAYINNGGTASIGDDSTHAIPAMAGSLHLGGDLGGTVRQAGGMLRVTGDTWLGPIGFSIAMPEIYPGPSGTQPGAYLLFGGAYETGSLFLSPGNPYPFYDITMDDAAFADSGSLFRQTAGTSVIRDR